MDQKDNKNKDEMREFFSTVIRCIANGNVVYKGDCAYIRLAPNSAISGEKLDAILYKNLLKLALYYIARKMNRDLDGQTIYNDLIIEKPLSDPSGAYDIRIHGNGIAKNLVQWAKWELEDWKSKDSLLVSPNSWAILTGLKWDDEMIKDALFSCLQSDVKTRNPKYFILRRGGDPAFEMTPKILITDIGLHKGLDFHAENMFQKAKDAFLDGIKKAAKSLGIGGSDTLEIRYGNLSGIFGAKPSYALVTPDPQILYLLKKADEIRREAIWRQGMIDIYESIRPDLTIVFNRAREALKKNYPGLQQERLEDLAKKFGELAFNETINGFYGSYRFEPSDISWMKNGDPDFDAKYKLYVSDCWNIEFEPEKATYSIVGQDQTDLVQLVVGKLACEFNLSCPQITPVTGRKANFFKPYDTINGLAIQMRDKKELESFIWEVETLRQKLYPDF